MQKIKGIDLSQPGDFILFKGTLYVIRSVEETVNGHLLTVDNDKTIEVSQSQAYTIYRTVEPPR